MTNIESRIININSSNAIIKNNSTYNSDVVFKFNGLISKKKHIKKINYQILDACFPVSFYNVDYTNNILKYSINSINYTITADVGNYNFNSLSTNLISKFLINGHIFSIVINKQNGIITFSTTTTNFILLISSMFSILGLYNSNHSSSSFSLKADYPLNLLGITKIKILSNNLLSDNLDSNNNTNLIGCVLVDEPSFGIITYENKSQSKLSLKNDIINEIDIQLTDQNDYLINWNNIDWNLTLLLEFIIDEKDNNNIDEFKSIIENQKEILNQIQQPGQSQPEQTQSINPISDDDLEFFIYSNPNFTD